MNLPISPGVEAKEPPPTADEQRPLLAKVAVGLALLTFLIFLPVVEYEFINYDDDVFVTNNPKVAPGFTWEGVKWAFTSADIDYWRPLSWLSHMLDIELAGAMAGFHHLSSLLIHIGAAVFCFLAFQRLSGEVWPSAVAAALFAWHPLHVESVAWIGERKDVLCGLFWFYTIWAYAGYVKRPSSRGFLTTFLGFVLAVMSKPMVVTLPCVLMLLDFWPLRRIQFPAPLEWRVAGLLRFARTWWPLIKEKIPLFAVVAVLCVSTIYSQHRVGAMSSLTGLPWDARIQGALYGYGMYLTQLFLPTNLCVLYPHLGSSVQTMVWLPPAAFLVAFTAVVLWWAGRIPLLFTGWFWFLGVLVPVIGLVQVGEQAHADRYTYLPLTGLFLILVWGVREVAQRLGKTGLLPWAVGAVLIACALITRAQLPHWQNSTTLFRRTVEVTADNATALNNYGADLSVRGFNREAIPYLLESFRLYPTQLPLFNLSSVYAELGQPKRSLKFMHEAFRMDPKGNFANEQIRMLLNELRRYPDDPLRRHILASAFALRGDYAKAVDYMREAAKLAPEDPDIQVDLAAYLGLAGKEVEAIQTLQSHLRTNPKSLMARNNLGALLSKQGRLTEALEHLKAVVEQQPEHVDSRHNLAILLAKLGQHEQARTEFDRVLKQQPDYRPSMQHLAWLLATKAAVRDGNRAKALALELLQRTQKPDATLLDVAAAACAAAGDFEGAKSLIAAALVAAEKKPDSVVKPLQSRQTLYRGSQAYSE